MSRNLAASRARILALAGLCALPGAAGRGATFEVDPSASSCDDRAGRPFCTLRAAMVAAGARAGADTIVLAPGSLHRLTAPDDQEGGANGLPVVRDALAVRGDGAVIERSTAQGTPAFRLLQVAAGGDLRLHGLTLRNGDTRGLSGERDGAGIWNLGTLALDGCRLEGNVAGGDGGGLRNDGTARIERSTIQDNEASGFGAVGGGICNLTLEGPGVVTVTTSTIAGNRSATLAGGLWNEGVATVANSTLSGNEAAQDGGGVRNNGRLELHHVTVAGNSAGGSGGGLHDLGELTVASSIVAGNSAAAGPDCAGHPAWLGMNLLGDAGGCRPGQRPGGLLMGEDPRLGPLRHNGGPTFTHALGAGSPAIDAVEQGAPAGRPGNCPAEDQRGVSRPRAERCDLGAYESVSRVAVHAGAACEPARPDCSIAAALEILADTGVLELSPGLHRANLRLARDATLAGAGAGKTVLDGGGTGRVLHIEPDVRVIVRGVTVTGGRLDREMERDGGGIWNMGTLTLERCEVTGNVAVDDGGGIRNDGTLTVSESFVHGNQATRWGSVGGGIYSPVLLGTPELAVVASTISGNVAGDHGGGIWCEGAVTLVNSTVSGNSAAHTGGGIRNNGELAVRNSTIAGNRAGTTGGGIENLGAATLANTLLAANSAVAGGADCHGPFASGGHNLVREVEGCGIAEGGEGDLLGSDPELTPLADHGGPTPTHALPAASPAVDAGSPAPAGSGGACAAADQRGSRRPMDGDGDGRSLCDIGAFEAPAAGPTAGGRE